MKKPKDIDMLVGLAAWLPTDSLISYCPYHNELSEGYFKAHYCEDCIDLGYLNHDYPRIYCPFVI